LSASVIPLITSDYLRIAEALKYKKTSGSGICKIMEKTEHFHRKGPIPVNKSREMAGNVFSSSQGGMKYNSFFISK